MAETLANDPDPNAEDEMATGDAESPENGTEESEGPGFDPPSFDPGGEA